MADIIIYGASDDLIEIEGVVRDELNPPYGKPAVVTIKVDDIVWAKVPIEYDSDGVWRIQPTAIYAPVAFVAARGENEGEDEHGCPGYSDKVVIDMGAIETRRINVALEEEN
jgi:hypothetical protein